MSLKTILIMISALLTISSVMPYLADVLRRRTKPQVVTWLVWTVLTTITLVATLHDGQFATSMMLLAGTLATLSIVIFGWKYGDRTFEPLDIFCLSGAGVGLLCLLLVHSTVLTVLVTMSVDFVGSIPTLKHAWLKPQEETWTTFAIATLAAICTLMAISTWTLTGILPAAYLLAANSTLALIIISRRALRSLPAKQPL